MRDYAALYEQLKYRTSDDGLLEVSALDGNARVSYRWSSNGRRYEFQATFDQVIDAVERLNTSDLWPELDRLQASMCLFSVHLYEALDTAPEGAKRLVIDKSGISAVA